MKLRTLLVLATVGLVAAAPAHDFGSRNQVKPFAPDINDQKFQEAVMNAHWYWRRLHCAQDLRWDDNLARAAAASVNACTKNVQHDRAGSNLSGVSPAPENYDVWITFARDAVHGWHEEETKYQYNNPHYDEAWGHFSQMVWRETSKIGCAVGHCSTGQNYPGRIYCFYETAGNNVAEGTFRQQVWPPVCADPSRHEVQDRYHF